MKKVLIIGNNDVGLYNFRKELIESLIAQNYQVIFTVPYGEKVDLLLETGASYYPVDLNRRGKNLIKDYITFKNYKTLLLKIKPDIVLTYTIKPNIYGGIAAKQLHIPCIATITGLGTYLQDRGLRTKLIKVLYRYGISRNQMVIFQNEGNKDFFVMEGLVNAERITVVPGSGINTDHYSPNPIPHETLNFLFIARIMRDKGIEEYLQAAQEIKRKYTNVKFQILGPYDEERIKKMVQEMVNAGIVEYLGVSSDTRTEMANADCIVLPSYHEGMSNVILEAASFGLPVITTDIDGCREAVEDGITGFLCEKQNAASLTIAMERFIELDAIKRKEMGKRGRIKMMNEFDRKFVIKKYIEMINYIVES